MGGRYSIATLLWHGHVMDRPGMTVPVVGVGICVRKRQDVGLALVTQDLAAREGMTSMLPFQSPGGLADERQAATRGVVPPAG